MKFLNTAKTGISLLLTVVLLVYGCTSQASYTPQTLAVEIKDMKFQPDELKLHKGDTVIWTNKDIVAHDVTEVNKAWTSSPIAPGASWQKVITESASYYCSIHIIMKGKLIVEK